MRWMVLHRRVELAALINQDLSGFSLLLVFYYVHWRTMSVAEHSRF
jgi:hypothetical protein